MMNDAMEMDDDDDIDEEADNVIKGILFWNIFYLFNNLYKKINI